MNLNAASVFRTAARRKTSTTTEFPVVVPENPVVVLVFPGTTLVKTNATQVGRARQMSAKDVTGEFPLSPPLRPFVDMKFLFQSDA